MKTMHSAGVVIFYCDEGERVYLLLNHPHGHWDFAKGKIEQGETKQDAALRELREETGLTTVLIPEFEQSITYIFTDERGEQIKKTVYFFVGEAKGTAIVISGEHVGHSWFSYERAYELASFDEAKRVLKQAHEFLSQREQCGL